MNQDSQQSDALENVRIVLVGTLHSGNIGSAARAMKTMGCRDLRLVAPVDFPSHEANYRAVAAADILESAQVYDTLVEAVSDCSLVIGTSARSRKILWPLTTPRKCMESLTAKPTFPRVALVFGREDHGLSNEELHLCHQHVHVPASDDYPTLNLAATVQILCYELRMAILQSQAPEKLEAPEWDEPPATIEDMERYYVHLEETLTAIGFLNPAAPRQLMTRLRRLYNRVEVDQMEMNILRGICTETLKSLDQHQQSRSKVAE